MRFKDLVIGAVFEFDYSDYGVLPLCHGLARGPWVKTSARKYVRQDNHNFKCRVGTINVKVIKQ